MSPRLSGDVLPQPSTKTGDVGAMRTLHPYRFPMPYVGEQEDYPSNLGPILCFEYGWGTVGDGYRLPHIRTRMDEVLLAQLLIVTVGLVGFGIWFTRLSMKLGDALDDISDSDEQLAEIREMITQVAQVLNHLPEILPQFHMNNSPTDFLKPIVEAFVGNITGTPPLKTVGPGQGVDGRFNGTPKEQTENTP